MVFGYSGVKDGGQTLIVSSAEIKSKETVAKREGIFYDPKELKPRELREAGMETTVREEGQVLVLRLEGKLDAASAPSFVALFEEHVAPGAARIVLVDASGLDYVSSAGVRVLLHAAKKLEAQGGRLVIAGLSGMVARLFELSYLTHVFTVYASVSDALRELSRPV